MKVQVSLLSALGIKSRKLTREFYDRPTLEVARDIVGKRIVFNSPGGSLSARIVEVEAYIGKSDPACHAFGRRTRRCEPLYGPPGNSYVYLIYGMYYCFNFVTEPEGEAAAVLLRAAEPETGIAVMQANSAVRAGSRSPDRLLNGPGKFCRSFGISSEHNCLDLSGEEIYLEDLSGKVGQIGVSKRIGIAKGVELPWRFFDSTSPALSRKV